MTKEALLGYLSDTNGADAVEVAEEFNSTYFAAAMALLRLSRQNLVTRRLDPDTGIYWYRLTEHGARRLAYLESKAP